MKGWNSKNGHQISLLNKDSYRIAILADSHSNYHSLSKVVASINATEGIDFVVHLGDFTDRALPIEFSYFMEIFQKLRYPSLVVLGNHDAIGFGPRLYARIFGPANYAVNAGWLQLILLNANTLETGPIDFNWLEKTLSADPETIETRVIFRHTNHDNPVHHSKADTAQFEALTEKYHVPMVINGHRHAFHTQRKKKTTFHQVSRTEGEAFTIIDVQRDHTLLQTCKKGGCPDASATKIVH